MKGIIQDSVEKKKRGNGAGVERRTKDATPEG